jgi:hypothetical protein
MELDHVGLAGKAEFEAAQPYPAGDPDAGTRLCLSVVVRFLVQVLTLHGQPVLVPLLLVVDERTLPRAVDQVL